MTSTPNLELRLITDTIKLSLREPLDNVSKKLVGHKVSKQADSEMQRIYLRLLGQGVELMFENESLSAIFLYLTGGPDECGSFVGTTDLLSRDVLNDADGLKFSETLESQGFNPTKRTYPFSLDRLNDEIRFRLEKRKDMAMVIIDDGAMVR